MHTLIRIACILVAASIGAAASASPLQPISPWNVAYEDAQCTASRSYGSDKHPITLTLVPSVTGAAMRLLFIRDGASDTREDAATVKLGSREPLQTFAFVFQPSGTHHQVRSITLPMDQFQAAAAAPSITMVSGDMAVALATDQLPDMMAELHKCLADLQQYWNVEKMAPVRSVATGPGKVGIFTSADYPPLAVALHQSGTVGVTLLVDEKGQVADCTVDKPSGAALLDAATCYMLEKRARFLPAQDAKGQPVRSAGSQTVTWVLQE